MSLHRVRRSRAGTRGRRTQAGPRRRRGGGVTPLRIVLKTEAEYDAAQDELERKAYRAGIMYARLRALQRTKPYPAPTVIIDMVQRQLDELADRVSMLLSAMVDWDMEHMDDEDD